MENQIEEIKETIKEILKENKIKGLKNLESTHICNDMIEFSITLKKPTIEELKDSVDEIYKKLKEVRKSCNFHGSPYEQHSFIVIEKNGYEIVFNSPVGSNGDNDWRYYNKIMISIQVSPIDQ